MLGMEQIPPRRRGERGADQWGAGVFSDGSRRTNCPWEKLLQKAVPLLISTFN